MSQRSQGTPSPSKKPKSSRAGKRGEKNGRENPLWLKKSAEIAFRISTALQDLQITQSELGQRLNVSRQHINKIVKGQENLTLETIARIEEVLNVSLISIPGNRISSFADSQRDDATQSHDSNQRKGSGRKIKPILYQTFAEKERLERTLFARIPSVKRKAAAESLMSIFKRPISKKAAGKRSAKK